MRVNGTDKTYHSDFTKTHHFNRTIHIFLTRGLVFSIGPSLDERSTPPHNPPLAPITNIHGVNLAVIPVDGEADEVACEPTEERSLFNGKKS